jgi:hypothetical protein
MTGSSTTPRPIFEHHHGARAQTFAERERRAAHRAGGNRTLTLRADYTYTSRFFHEPGEGNIAYGAGTLLTEERPMVC